MKNLKVNIKDDILSETQEIAEGLGIDVNQYIVDAISLFNKKQKRELIREQLSKSSLLVREESMKVLKEFEAIDDFDFDK